MALHANGGGTFSFVAYAQMLSNSLESRIMAVSTYDAHDYEGRRMGGIAATQKGRRLKVEHYGGREAALTCCPVAAAIITGAPGQRRTTHVRNLIKAVTDGCSTFVDGHYAPSVALGQGIVWLDRRMRVPLVGLPETIRNLIVGMPLGNIVGHEWLPEGIVRSQTEIAGKLQIEIDYEPYPLLPVLESIGLTINDVR